MWIDDRITVYALAKDGYAEHQGSQLLPAVDIALIASLLSIPTQNEAVKALRHKLAAAARRPPDL